MLVIYGIDNLYLFLSDIGEIYGFTANGCHITSRRYDIADIGLIERGFASPHLAFYLLRQAETCVAVILVTALIDKVLGGSFNSKHDTFGDFLIGNEIPDRCYLHVGHLKVVMGVVFGVIVETVLPTGDIL